MYNKLNSIVVNKLPKTKTKKVFLACVGGGGGGGGRGGGGSSVKGGEDAGESENPSAAGCFLNYSYIGGREISIA